MLTRAQHQLLTFVARFTTENGWAPSYDEMRVAMGLASKSGVNRLMEALIERGFIAKRFHNRARAIEVIRMPGDIGPKAVSSDATSELMAALRTLIRAVDAFNRTGLPIEALETARALVTRLEGAR